MPVIRINRREIEVDEGTTIMQAADKLGIYIPRYCYHDGLSIAGCCRICGVEVEESPKLMMACATPVKDGMVVRTDTERVRMGQKTVQEFLLINHPLDCPVCDQAGECWLQDYAYDYGFAESRFREQKIKQRKKDVGKNLLLYADRCIMCTRCVRFAREVSGYNQIGVFGRGSQSEIDIFPGLRIDDNLSGNIADICPVGAFLIKDFLFKRRVWELQTTMSVCPACTVGCNVFLHHAEGRIQRVLPRYNPRVNGHWMCDIGRLDYKFVASGDRLKKPIFKREELFEQPAWNEALSRAAAHIREIITRRGPDSFAFVVSSDATNEEAFVVARLADALGCAQNLRLLPGERGEEEHFLGGFVIESDRSPNARGVLAILKHFMPEDAKDKMTDPNSISAKAGFFILCGPHSNKEAVETLARSAKKAEFSLVQAILPSALTEAATMVLPGAAYAEKEGTYTNYRGIIQRLYPAFEPPGEAGHDLNIMLELAEAMKEGLDFKTINEVSRDLSRRIEGYVAIEHIDPMGWAGIM